MSQPLELPLPLVHGAAVPPAVPSLLDIGDNERVIALVNATASAWDHSSAPPPAGRRPVAILLDRFGKWTHKQGAHEARRRMATESHTRPPIHWHRRTNTRAGKDPRLVDWVFDRPIARAIADRAFRLAVMRPNEHTLVLADRLTEIGVVGGAKVCRGDLLSPGAWADALCRLLDLRADPITDELLRGAFGWTGMSARLYGEHEPGGGR